MIVADASVAVDALVSDGAARRLFGAEHVAVPHLVDSEVAHALRGLERQGAIGTDAATQAFDAWSRLGLDRYPVNGILGRIWELRANLTAYDASYVALAETLGCALVTRDAKLAGAPGLRSSVVVLGSA